MGQTLGEGLDACRTVIAERETLHGKCIEQCLAPKTQLLLRRESIITLF